MEQSLKKASSVFIGHGSPTYALRDNPFSPTWVNFMKEIPPISAVIVISAHWYGPGLAVTANKQAVTVHDIGGFDPEFYDIQYPAPGSPELCTRVQTLLAPESVSLSLKWGLDHGAWSVLRHMLPEANVPVI